eukprot:scaffold7412_cov123-Isochrysis_galbana.AAC.14
MESERADQYGHARAFPFSNSLTRLRLLYSHSPQNPLPTNPFGKVSWGGMPQTLLITYKKVLNRKRYTLALAATRRNTILQYLTFAVRLLPLPIPILSTSILILQAAFCGGMVSELRALLQPGLGYIGSLGFSVVLSPVSASLSTSLRADYIDEL